MVLIPVRHKPDMEHQASLPRRISKVGRLMASSFALTWENALNDLRLISKKRLVMEGWQKGLTQVTAKVSDSAYLAVSLPQAPHSQGKTPACRQ